MSSLRWTFVALILGVPAPAIIGCSSWDERIAELERLEPATLVYLALSRPVTSNFEEPRNMEPEILVLLERAPERYLSALATYLDPAYDPNAASSPSQWAPQRAVELAGRYLGAPGRALLQDVDARARRDTDALEARERAVLGDRGAHARLLDEMRSEVWKYQRLERPVPGVFSRVADPSLADAVLEHIRCFDASFLEADVECLGRVNRFDDRVRARLRKVVRTSPHCYPSPTLDRLMGS